MQPYDGKEDSRRQDVDQELAGKRARLYQALDTFCANAVKRVEGGQMHFDLQVDEQAQALTRDLVNAHRSYLMILGEELKKVDAREGEKHVDAAGRAWVKIGADPSDLFRRAILDGALARYHVEIAQNLATKWDLTSSVEGQEIRRSSSPSHSKPINVTDERPGILGALSRLFKELKNL